MAELVRKVHVARTPAEVFAWHEQPHALERLTPPWERVRVEQRPVGLTDGQRVVLRSRVGPWWQRWVAEHHSYERGRLFADRQIEGPFAGWNHWHRFESDGADGCWMTDEIDYAVPGGALGAGLAGSWVREKLERMFEYRHAVLRQDLEQPMRTRGTVLMSGASGLLGQALWHYLSTQGWRVVRLVRREAEGTDEVAWDPTGGTVNWPEAFVCDAVVHLAGAGIADRRWSRERKQDLEQSRVLGTRTLVNALAELARPPRVLLSGSAVGYYGNQAGNDEERTEEAGQGTGFLADLCAAWEAEAGRVERLGTRWIGLRTGIVLTPAGGALGKMLPAFRAGLGGPLGDGRQWQSWISVDDWVRACAHGLDTEELNGPVNLCASCPVPQREFAEVLASVLHRPSLFPTPAWGLRTLFGEMADEALLASARVLPRKLVASGFSFLHPSLEKALRQVLGKTTRS